MARLCMVSSAVFALVLVVLTPNVETTPTPKEKAPIISSPDKLLFFNPQKTNTKSFIQRRGELIDQYLIKEQTFEIKVDPVDDILRDTIYATKEAQWNARPIVSFHNDPVTKNTDASLKEYLAFLSNNIMHPKLGLFVSDASLENPSVSFGSSINYDRVSNNPKTVAKFMPARREVAYIKDLRHIGRVIAMAILSKQFMDVTFDEALYEMIAERKLPTFKTDVNGPNRIFMSQPTNGPTCYQFTHFLEPTTPDTSADNTLKGFLLTFTEPNVLQDALLLIDDFKNKPVLFPMALLCQGIFDVIPQDAFSQFSKDEIRTLISGDTREMQVRDWQRFSNIVVKDLDNVHSSGLFFDYIKEADKKVHSQLLSFITGTSRLPLGILNHNDAPVFSDEFEQSKPFVNVEWPGTSGSSLPLDSKINTVSESKPAAYINIVLSDKTDTALTADPFTNTLYLPNYTSKEDFQIHMANALRTMCGLSTWFISAALFHQGS